MKKLLLLAVGAIAGFSSAYADVIKLDGALTPVTDLVEGKQYLIYDASKLKKTGDASDSDRTAFRYVNTTNDAILGDHTTTPSAAEKRFLTKADAEAYLWTVTGNRTDGWYFQNVATGKYIPLSNNLANGSNPNMKVVEAKPDKTYSFVLSDDTNKAFVVAYGDGTADQSVWDGRPNDVFSMTNWKLNDNGNNNHWYQFVEYDAATMAPNDDDISDIQNALATEIAKLPALSTLTPFKDKTPGYYASADDENLDAYKTWLNQVTALTTSTAVTVTELLQTIEEVKAAVAAGGPGVNTNLGVAEGKYKIFCRDNGFIYDANRDDNHVMTSTQVGDTEYCSDPNSVDEDNHYWEVVADGDNYYIRNVGSQKYLVAPATQSAQQYWTLSETEHSAITIKTSALRGYPQVEILGNNVHMGITGGWPNQTYVVSYYASNDPGSPFTFASELDVAKDALKAAIDAKTSNIGTGVGKYSYDNDGATVIANAQNVYGNSEATVAELKEATTAVEAVTKSLNPVVAGRFYRFQNVSSSKYISNNVENTAIGNVTADYIKMEEDQAGNKSDNIFYFDGHHLVAYKSGLVLGKVSDVNDPNRQSWSFVPVENTTLAADNVQFKESGTPGKYNIISAVTTTSTRHLHGSTNYVNVGGSDGGNDYRWAITEVQFLPVYFGDNLETTLYLPVGVDSKNIKGRIEAHDLSYNPEKTSELVKAQTAAQSIEPEHGYFVRKIGTDNGSGWNGTTKCIYLQLNYAAVATSAESSNVLSGSIYATAPTDKHFVLDDHSDENVNPTFSVASASIPGFTAHVVAPTEHSHAQYTVFDYGKQTSGISEVVAGGENGAEVIYDLQGRRVANASKGIFIINGVKTLVK